MRRSRAVLRALGAAGLALLLAAQPATAVTWQPSVTLSGTSETVGGAPGSIAVSLGRVFVTYVEDQRAWVRTSADGGVTFLPPFPVSDAAAVASSPSVAAGSGTGYVEWTETPPGGTPQVWFRRSTDGGASWSTAVAMTPAGTSAVTDGRLFAISGRVFLVYTDDVLDHVLVRRSTTSGLSFGDPVVVGTSHTGGRVTMAFGDQVTYLAWESSVGNVRLRRSTTGGISWGEVRTIQLDSSGHTVLALPWLAARGSRAIIAMRATSGIVVRSTADRGATWAGRIRVTGSAIGAPVITRSASGWWLAYASCGGTDCEAMKLALRTSRDGVTWSSPASVAGGGLMFALGGAFSSRDGRVWLSWRQEPTWEWIGVYVVKARGGS
jgi:hypothetical protein